MHTSLQFQKDDERVKLVGATDYDENDDVYDLEINSSYSDKISNGSANGYVENASYPSWISSLDEFRYDAFNIKEKSEYCAFGKCLLRVPFVVECS